MPTLTLSSNHVPSPILYRRLMFLLLLLAVPARAQSRETLSPSLSNRAAAEILPSRLTENWRAAGEVRKLPATATSVLPDAALYSEFGLRSLSIRNYAKGTERITIEAFETNTPAGAYGLFTLHLGARETDYRDLHQGRHYFRITGSAATDEALTAALRQTAAADEDGPPVLPSHLPANALPGSEKYLLGPAGVARLGGFDDLQPVLDFTGGAEAAAASYKNGAGQMELLLLEYHTPQLASDAFAKLQGHFNSLPENEQQRRILKRVGNYIVQATRIEDRAAAQSLVDQIKYTAKVYWQGKKISDIPLDFRPPDPTAVQEAFQTTAIIVRSFYWIGLMLITAILLGIIAGGTFFYWNRYRKRKLGIEDVFSDAGGSVRLNLDDFLLDPETPEIKQIGKGKADR
ncbi:MAG: DUF6599 family protein [Blastocatellia bacterium]|nr:DUF6599 family protein [Blastocatellia bacterium]